MDHHTMQECDEILTCINDVRRIVASPSSSSTISASTMGMIDDLEKKIKQNFLERVAEQHEQEVLAHKADICSEQHEQEVLAHKADADVCSEQHEQEVLAHKVDFCSEQHEQEVLAHKADNAMQTPLLLSTQREDHGRLLATPISMRRRRHSADDEFLKIVLRDAWRYSLGLGPKFMSAF
ncbi:hypothetical protein T484DRAFT_1784056 [Baffinella frigidus]|nr:hypothetical protein T484DRAFT_1784056 [Cryptophyta sp. CCMP2293]